MGKLQDTSYTHTCGKDKVSNFAETGMLLSHVFKAALAAAYNCRMVWVQINLIDWSGNFESNK